MLYMRLSRSQALIGISEIFYCDKRSVSNLRRACADGAYFFVKGVYRESI